MSSFAETIMRPNSFPILVGPCVLESEALALNVAEQIKTIEAKIKSQFPEDASNLIFIFKGSFDKANRSSIHSYRGPGLENGLKILGRIKKEFNLAVVSDIHEAAQCAPAAEVLDILQIPAFLCRQTDLIVAAAETGAVLNIKKGQFLSPPEVKNIRDKAEEAGNKNIFICERGTSFGYNNLVVDMRSFEQIKELGIRTIFDATHSCQLPGAGGDKSLGNSHFAPILARAAVAAGATGIFAETHPNPAEALSDGPNMIPLAQLEEALSSILKVRAACAAPDLSAA